jgi:cytoskeletal protein CcmA (bactofilin family)
MAKNGEPENVAVNLISQGTEIKGDISSTGDIRIDGSLIGTLNTRGKVVVGPTGKISGEITCKSSEISGYVEGKIGVAEILNLKASSKIMGDIETVKLSIEPGAIFTGKCKMTDINEKPGNGKGEKS